MTAGRNREGFTVAYQVSDGEHSLTIEATRLEVRPHDELFEFEVEGSKRMVSISRISPAHLSILLDGKSYNVEVEHFDREYQVLVRGEVYSFRVLDEREVEITHVEQPGGVKSLSAPMPGLVVEIMVSEGDSVSAGQTLLVLEAMKMQNEITAPASGTVSRVDVKAGASVNSGDSLVVLET